MIKATDLKGKAIISVDRAAKLGEVESAYVDAEARRIVALQVDLTDSHDKVAVPTDSIRTVGTDAVTVEGVRSLVHPSRLPEVGVGYGLGDLVGANVVTQSGKSLGKITNVYLDERDLRIVEYELSGDFWQTLSQEKPMFKPMEGMRLGKGMLIVPDAVERQVGEASQAMGGDERARMQGQSEQRDRPMEPAPPYPARGQEMPQRSEGEYYASSDSMFEMKKEELDTEQKVIEQRMRENQQQLQRLEEEKRRLGQSYEPQPQTRPEMPEERRYAAPPPEGMEPRMEPEPNLPTREAYQQPTEDEELLRKHIEEDRRLLERLQRNREMGEPPQRL